jgi:hypothetical protein
MDARNVSRPIDVRVLFSAGCAATPATVELIRSVADEMGLKVHLKLRLVESSAQAIALEFLGSPTVQVNGLDLDPGARGQSDFGLM